MIGQQLRQAREARDLTIQQVSRATHIRPHYLEALESEAFGALPSRAQARGFLRAYAGYLNLPVDELLAVMDAAPGAPVRTLPEPAVDGGAGEAGTTVSASPAKAYPAAQPFTGPLPAEVQAFFTEVGQRLRRQRELLGLSIEDVERQTRLRTFYLQALEAGELEQLPSPVQGRGMLNNYAAFLGLDPEPLLLRFAEGLQARRLTLQAQSPAAVPARAPGRRPRAADSAAPGEAAVRPPSLLRRLFSVEFLLAGLVVVFLVGFVVWGAVRIFALRQSQSQNPQATSRSISEVLLDPGTPSVTPTVVTPTPEEVLVFTPAPGGASQGEPVGTGVEADGTPEDGTPGAGGGSSGVQVYLTIRQRTWLRVLVDGEVQEEGRMPPDSAFQFSGEERIEVFTGNGAAVQVFYNGQDQGPLGEFGEVVYLIYSTEGVLTPTPTITPTSTPTVRPSPTPRGTPPPPTPTLAP